MNESKSFLPYERNFSRCPCRVAWALQRSLDQRDQGQGQSLLKTQPPAKWVPFVPAPESHMGVV